uniref:cytochrome-c oxidase n=1 Tax=Acanthoparyphium sp. WAK-2018 TaxID=2185117 RepID=A0A2S1YEI4_9TREM|nr:cytochrome c oxidase subunit II [Acanthoparyphium sp. WAK-2018]
MVFMNVLYMDLIQYMILLCSFIPVWVFMMLGWQLYWKDDISSHDNESDVVEFLWTVFPSGAIGSLCFLNLQCISNDDVELDCHLVKVIGHQWYWSYEINNGGEYDSMISDFVTGVDKPLRMPAYDFHRLLITSADVIHSFSVPEFNIKLDAIPGRLNWVTYCPDRVGIFIGYCTELCGAGHAYMPIVIEVVKRDLVPA